MSFSAYFSGDFQYPGFWETIQFPYVFTNNGGHYNTTDSIFTCPIYGTYFFIFSLNTGVTDIREGVNARIMVGSVEKSAVSCYNDGLDSSSNQCGNSAVLHCDQGEQVLISAYLPPLGQLFGANQRSTFSGFLIHADIQPYLNYSMSVI